MSVNLHLGVIVRNYKSEKSAMIEQAIRKVLEIEGIDSDLPPLVEMVDAKGPYLVSRTDPTSPVIISGAYEWAQQVNASLQTVAKMANDGPCQVTFEWHDADEE